MLYVQKENCPDDIQAQIDELTGTEEWDIIPEEPSSEQAKIIRERFFDKLKKGPIRETLISEQHGLCAYCMDRVVNSEDQTTIEHLIPLSKSKAGAMDYANWLAVCMGGQNIVPPQGEDRIVCCDVKKGNNITVLSPFNKAQMSRIAYYDDGTIFYSAPSGKRQRIIKHEINYTFGLNGKVDSKTGRSREDTTTGIVIQRKDAYIAMRDLLQELDSNGELTSDNIDKIRDDLLSETVWEPFIGVKLYVLRLFAENLSNS